VEAEQCRRFRTFLTVGLPTAAVISLLVPLLHAGAIALVPMVAVAHLVSLRLVLVRDASRLLGGRRRRFVRWMSRFAFLWIGLPGYGLTVTPLAGVVAGTATFAALTAAVHHYAAWSLRMERDRRPLQLWEKLLLTALALLTVAFFIALVLLSLVLGWSVAALVGWMRS
jgi:hypothetical protein